MATQSPTGCAGCGAPLPAAFVPTRYVCTFCQREQIIGPQAPPPPAPPPEPLPEPVPAPGLATPAPRIAVITLVAPLVLLIVVGVIVAVVAGGPGLRPKTGVGSGGVTPPGERLQWDSGSSPSVVVADVNGDGVEDFVGRYHLLVNQGSTSEMPVYVGAFDGKTLARIWAAGPYGNLEQAVTATHVAVAAGRVVVSDFRAHVHVLDLHTGKEIRVFSLSDRARSICSPADARHEVWIQVADGRHVTLDPITGKAASATARPAWCAPAEGAVCGEGPSTGGDPLGNGTGDPCGASPADTTALSKAGLSANHVMRSGDYAVAVGMKVPGTPTLMAAGFRRNGAMLWQKSIAPDAALASFEGFVPATLEGGRLYTVYTTSSPKTTRLVAFDALTGKRLFDVALPRSEDGSGPSWILPSSARLYVPHWTWLDVFDARDGAAIGTVGMW